MPACLNGFALGTVIQWSSPALPSLTCEPDQEDLEDCDYFFNSIEGSWISSFLVFGASFSCAAAGYLMGTIGRRRTMLMLSVPFVLGLVLILIPAPAGMSQDAAKGLFYVGRIIAGEVFILSTYLACSVECFVSGFASGSFSLLAPVYIGESVEDSIRGAMGACFQLMVTLGIFFAQALGSVVDWVLLTGILMAFPGTAATLHNCYG